ncbi:MAG: DegT/DnrJ/EryC1/StrS family aminotransferase [Candidatus Zambryskibacteria bacterium]
MPNRTNKKILEQKLAEMHGRRHCLFVSRATVAIYLALKSLGHKNGKVVIPSLVCLSVPNAVIYSGLKPIYCDVSLKDFNIDLNKLEKILSEEKNIRVVIVPHMYGHPTNMNRLMSLANKFKVAVIEDVAQAMGGDFRGKILGSFGDFSVLSFGHTKIIETSGGGALLFDKDEYKEKIIETEKELALLKQNKKLAEIYSETYYALMPLARKQKSLAALFSSFPYIFKDLYLFGSFDNNVIPGIYKKLSEIKDAVSKRNKNARYYKEHLIHPAIVHPDYKGNGVSWRYSFLIKGDKQQEIANAIRKKGIDISNWYHPVHLMYEFNHPKLKNAEYIGDHIFNLWVLPTLTKKELKKNSDAVLKVLNSQHFK